MSEPPSNALSVCSCILTLTAIKTSCKFPIIIKTLHNLFSFIFHVKSISLKITIIDIEKVFFFPLIKLQLPLLSSWWQFNHHQLLFSQHYWTVSPPRAEQRAVERGKLKWNYISSFNDVKFKWKSTRVKKIETDVCMCGKFSISETFASEEMTILIFFFLHLPCICHHFMCRISCSSLTIFIHFINLEDFSWCCGKYVWILMLKQMLSEAHLIWHRKFNLGTRYSDFNFIFVMWGFFHVTSWKCCQFWD